MNKTYLTHHGIKGQRWGVRRFQNDDGTLKPSGKARYNDNGKKKKAVDMSDEDLAKSNKRLQSEQQYNQLTGRPYKNLTSKTDITIKAGASAVGSFLAVSGVMALKDFVTGEKINLGKMLVPGLLAAVGGTIGSLTTSVGGQVKKG